MARSKVTKTKQSKSTPAPSGKTLIEQADSTTMVNSLATKSELDVVLPRWMSKCLYTNYKGLNPHLPTTDGQCLVDELQRAKDAKEAMGRIYHEENRLKFAPLSDKASIVPIQDSSEVKDVKMDKALKMFFQHKRNPLLLESWLQTSPLTT